jgi:hypothetical protein
VTRIGRKAKAAKRAPVVESQGLDLNEYVVRNILPGAAELCEKGIENEKRLQRDPNRFQRKVIDYYDTVVWADHGNGVATPTRMFETCEQQTIIPRMDRQPVNVPILRAPSEAGLHWAMYIMAMRSKMFGMGQDANEKARRFATSVTFRHVGSKESSIARSGVISSTAVH